MKNYLYKSLFTSAALLMGAAGLTGCSDDDMSKRYPDYDPRYQGEVKAENADIVIEAAATPVTIKFNTDMPWTAQVLDGQGDACSYATVSPESGEAGENTVTVNVQNNEDSENSRTVQVTISTEKGATTTVTILQNYKVLILDPAEIQDYEKYTCPESWNPHFEEGPEYMLRHDSYYSWHRMKQSEHFFVFWSPEFGADPNAADVPDAMKVDVDDLLVKAEQFFHTNIEVLNMATLGQGKSNLDNYKMQIYLIYQDEWLATGSGYDDKIGALWVNPATCHPVGSTIAHEIGHSFQYQTYADRIATGEAPNDFQSGFRYGFTGPDGAGNGGCAYWEQCAQWQAHMDYPEEQFDYANFPVWLSNHHRHFHHEWQRYASYWLQSYWVAKHGEEAYGRIWKESVAPEDAISAYTRIYNGGDYSKTREELAEYAMQMATYDINYNHVSELGMANQDRYRENMHYISDSGEYQIDYASCPGATGFNVISLTVPENGGTVSVDFRGLEYGAELHAKDKGQMVDGDGKITGTTRNYNTVGGAENMGWRYGLVALQGTTRTYSAIGKEKNGTVSLEVPAGAEYLFLVVQGSPEEYMSHGWDEVESNDPQFPYAFKVNGADCKWYEEEPEPVYTLVDENNVDVQLDLRISVSNPEWAIGAFSLNDEHVLGFFGLTADELTEKLVDLPSGEEVLPAEGTVVMANLESDGSYCFTGSSNNGFWCKENGDRTQWGDGQVVYTERGWAGDGTALSVTLGQAAGSFEPGAEVELRPAFIYTVGGVQKTIQYHIHYRYY